MSPIPVQNRVVVRGAGDVASGVIHRLIMAGFEVIALEKPSPECVRRLVCFAEASFEKKITVEGITAVLVKTVDEAVAIIGGSTIPLLIDPEASLLSDLAPMALIDGRMKKQGIDTTLNMAPIVIGLGPGFVVGENCHAAVETNRGIDLGRVIYKGSPAADTGAPAPVHGVAHRRVLRAPADGIFTASCNITEMVMTGHVIGHVDGIEVLSKTDGIVRGLIRSGLEVAQGQKIGDIDPRGKKDYCYKISDKANAVGGGVLEALMFLKKNLPDKNGSDIT